MTNEQEMAVKALARRMMAGLAEPAAELNGALYAARVTFDEGDAEQAEKWLQRMMEAMNRFASISLAFKAEGERMGLSRPDKAETEQG